MLKVFSESITNLPEQIPDPFKTLFTDEILKNLFNEQRRNELSINEDDIVRRSDRGMSMSESGITFTDPALSHQSDNHLNNEDFLKLKKTTVLTGNHG